jgi:divalent metal cation (Fe/Co/Zn/Cd) transporter
MTVEVIASIVAGLIVGRSFALLAFGGDSVIELISAYAVWSYLRKLGSGFFAHETESERTEKIATALLILLIPVIAGGVVYSYISGIKPEASVLGIAVALGAVIVMPVLWVQKKRIGSKGNILPLTIDAIESATCFFMSVALLGGLLLNYFLHITWADYVATAIILGFISLEIRESIQEMRGEEDGE